LNAALRFTRDDLIAGTTPNKTPVSTETPIANRPTRASSRRVAPGALRDGIASAVSWMIAVPIGVFAFGYFVTRWLLKNLSTRGPVAAGEGLMMTRMVALTDQRPITYATSRRSYRHRCRIGFFRRLLSQRSSASRHSRCASPQTRAGSAVGAVSDGIDRLQEQRGIMRRCAKGLGYDNAHHLNMDLLPGVP